MSVMLQYNTNTNFHKLKIDLS